MAQNSRRRSHCGKTGTPPQKYAQSAPTPQPRPSRQTPEPGGGAPDRQADPRHQTPLRQAGEAHFRQPSTRPLPDPKPSMGHKKPAALSKRSIRHSARINAENRP
ncbi:hypothetical protein NDU88_005798 [Pleurodeles waltl]|uniref:Uncharacterized protein n=1 Tax=Pleurodeles waltl TaxID=8319 RepID=A0AAV7RKP9_PLEWA|nr:hypothetical protein NDU88_005798 [Pleurodeles waltl]